MKKRSAASSSSTQPEPTFFLDRCLGRKVIPDALRSAGFLIHVHEELFPPDTPDEHWLREVGQRGWYVLTKDQRIRYRRIELEALINAGIGAFVLTAGDLQGADMAAVFVEGMPKIRKFIAKVRPPFVATMTRSGEIRRIR